MSHLGEQVELNGYSTVKQLVNAVASLRSRHFPLKIYAGEDFENTDGAKSRGGVALLCVRVHCEGIHMSLETL